MKPVGLIPARMGASRFPGKVLADLGGKPMLWHVYQRAMASGVLDRVVVCTPDAAIMGACNRLDIPVVGTPVVRTGTDCIAAAVRERDDIPGTAFLNLQGDEPTVSPEAIRLVAAELATGESVVNGYCAITSPDDVLDTNVVKVVMSMSGNALAFSRAPIPHPKMGEAAGYHRVVGIYGFQRDALLIFPRLAVGPLELAEGIELYRYLENDRDVLMVEVPVPGHAVDTPEDLERVRALMGWSGAGVC